MSKVYKCRFCGFESGSIDDFEPDEQNHAGFWCPYCDGFTYYEKENRSFLLYLEDPSKEETYVKPAFLVHCSPLRYPGGKTKMIGTVYNACRKDHMKNFIEPFAGGASVGLALLLSGNIRELYLNDQDYGIYALYKTIKEDPEILTERIRSFVPSEAEYKKCQKKVLSGYKGCSLPDAAWCVLVVNRLAFSGIAFANCMKNPSARWNPDTLCRRINRIHQHAEHLHVEHMDALAYIEEKYWMQRATLFIDPPYFEKGEKLYPCSYSKEDHYQLSFLLDELYKGVPGADILVTYDLQKEISEMYDYPEQIVIGRKYSIAN